MARPTKYTDDLIEKAPLYLEDWSKEGDVVPSQAGLAVYLQVSIACVENWGRDETKPEFLRVLDKIQSLQRSTLINKGLGGDFNATIAKLVLTKHGYHDKVEQTTIKTLDDLTDEEIDREIKLRQAEIQDGEPK